MSALRLPSFEETLRYGRPEIAPLPRPPRRRRHLRLVPPPEPYAAISFDQNLGTATAGGGSGASVVLTTTAIAAAASRIVVLFSWFDSGTSTLTVTDPGGTYVKDKQFDNGSDHFAIFSRVLVGSLASGSSITLAWTTSNGAAIGGELASAASFLGTTGVDTTATNATTGTSYASGSASNTVADALFIGGAGNEAATTSEPGSMTSGTQLAGLWLAGAQQGFKTGYLIASSVASQSIAGTWTNTSTASTGAMVVYRGTAQPLPQPHLPWMAPQGHVAPAI